MDLPIRPLLKSVNTIVSVRIVDESGIAVESPYKLSDGDNIFHCIATHIDGSEAPFKVYWTCPRFSNHSTNVDFYGVLGAQAVETVTLHASPNHERYSELACWVMFPEGPNTQAGRFPHASTGIIYS